MKKTTITLLVFVLLFSVSSSFVSNKRVNALSGADFKPGRIIDDVIFTNKTSMTTTQIQQFLESKVVGGSCDTDGSRPTTSTPNHWNSAAGRYYTHAEWGALYGNPAPFVCLTTYRENPTTKITNLGNPGLVISGAQTAAEIIYNAGQQYNINPQVLIVLLQKEQSLVTDDWPWASQYASATGAYCPDTAACDATKAGFGTQVREAARLFRYYMDTPWLYFVGNNYVLYNPNTACGGTTVNIENKATEALYHYTPYQPNAAALNNLYGTGDSCSAYGNRNFWRMFNDWFGSSLGLPRDSSLQSVTNNGGALEIGQTRTVTIALLNTGNDTWCADGYCSGGSLPTRLVSWGFKPFSFYDKSDPAWVSPDQVAMTTPTVKSGEIGYFTFRILAPNTRGLSASSQFVPLISAATFVPKSAVWVGGSVYGPPMQLMSTTPAVTTTILPNQRTHVTVVIRNKSVSTWYSETGRSANQYPFRLMTPGYASSPYYDPDDSNWLSPNQIAMQTATVKPGEDAIFQFDVKGPFTQIEAYDLHLLPVIDGVSFLDDIGIHVSLNTPKPLLSYEYVSAINPPAYVLGGSPSTPQKVTLIIKNTSNVVWRNETAGRANRVRLMMDFPRYRQSIFYDDTDTAWLTKDQISMKTAVVNPGENAQFDFYWKVPTKPGNYLEYFTLVADGYGFFPSYGHAFRTIVN